MVLFLETCIRRRPINIYHKERVYLMKRSVKRSIYIQVMLFSMSGISTAFIDKKMELLIRHGKYLSRREPRRRNWKINYIRKI